MSLVSAVRNRRLNLSLVLALLGALGCSNAGSDDSGGGGGEGSSGLTERDGIPSDDFVDQLLYFVSSERDAHGLFAIRASAPDEPPVNVDPNFPVSTVSATHSFLIAEPESDGGYRLRQRGLVYGARDDAIWWSLDGEEQLYLAKTDPAQLAAPVQQVTNYAFEPGTISGAVFSSAIVGDSLETSSVWIGFDNARIDLGAGADQPAMRLPGTEEDPEGEDSQLVSVMRGEDSLLHEHWLYLATKTLLFCGRDFATGTPVIDERTGEPMTDVRSARSIAVINEADHLVAIIRDADPDRTTLYRVTRPEGGDPGQALELLDATGEALVYGNTGKRTLNVNALFSWSNGEHWYVIENDDGSPTALTQVARDGWQKLDLGGAIVNSPLIPVGDGFAWSVFDFASATAGGVGAQLEWIHPTAGEPATWERQAISDAPEYGGTSPLLSAFSAGLAGAPTTVPQGDGSLGWMYYGGGHDGLYAVQVTSGEVVHIPGNARWVGASISSHVETVDDTLFYEHTQMSELFILFKDNRLGAIEAADPGAGVVVLGRLPETTEDVEIGAGVGPARLVRVTHEDRSAEVMFVDTRTKDSLRPLMPKPASDWEYAEGDGNPVTIPAHLTAPR